MAERKQVTVEGLYLQIHDAANFMRSELARLVMENETLKLKVAELTEVKAAEKKEA